MNFIKERIIDIVLIAITSVILVVLVIRYEESTTTDFWKIFIVLNFLLAYCLENIFRNREKNNVLVWNIFRTIVMLTVTFALLTLIAIGKIHEILIYLLILLIFNIVWYVLETMKP